MEGYLLMWQSGGDEIHVDLISPEDAARFSDNIEEPEKALPYTPLIHWFTQTRCGEPWPFNDCKIFGTICVCFA
jgi:hypothetical protein